REISMGIGVARKLSPAMNRGEVQAAAADVAALGPRTAAPVSLTPAGLQENLDRMSRSQVGWLWHAVLETRMDDEMGQRSKGECIIELIQQAKSREKLPGLMQELLKFRSNLVGP